MRERAKRASASETYSYFHGFKVLFMYYAYIIKCTFHFNIYLWYVMLYAIINDSLYRQNT